MKLTILPMSMFPSWIILLIQAFKIKNLVYSMTHGCKLRSRLPCGELENLYIAGNCGKMRHLKPCMPLNILWVKSSALW